jgi:diacylglycerol kinase family enzyme
MIDAGQVDDCWFFNVAGVGLDAQIARHMTRPGARRGLAGYVQLTFSELPFYRAQPYTIDLSGTSASYRALFVAIANSRQYGNGAQIAPAARLDDGHLDLVIVESQPLWRLLAQVPALFGGTLRSGRGLQMIPITEAVIRGSGSLAFHVDGEPMHGGNALRIRTRPGALAVMAPN